MPIWFLNMCASGWNRLGAEDYLLGLVGWMPTINEFLDTTTIKGSVEAQRTVNVLYRLFFRFCDFSKLLPDSKDSDTFKRLLVTYRRLKGLNSCAR